MTGLVAHRVDLLTLAGPRLDKVERALVESGLCCTQTAYGTGIGDDFCRAPLTADEKAQGSIWCSAHERAAVDNFPGHPLPRLVPEDRRA